MKLEQDSQFLWKYDLVVLGPLLYCCPLNIAQQEEMIAPLLGEDECIV